MGFYNVQQGDAPYLKVLADTYAMSDNYHQAVSGRNRRQPHHARHRRRDLVQRRQRQSLAAAQPLVAGHQNAGTVDEVENPDPLPGTNNWYTEDGYGGGSYGSPSYGGGSYSECSDSRSPASRRSSTI